jgi:hypothetical protein
MCRAEQEAPQQARQTSGADEDSCTDKEKEAGKSLEDEHTSPAGPGWCELPTDLVEASVIAEAVPDACETNNRSPVDWLACNSLRGLETRSFHLSARAALWLFVCRLLELN